MTSIWSPTTNLIRMYRCGWRLARWSLRRINLYLQWLAAGGVTVTPPEGVDAKMILSRRARKMSLMSSYCGAVLQSTSVTCRFRHVLHSIQQPSRKGDPVLFIRGPRKGQFWPLYIVLMTGSSWFQSYIKERPSLQATKPTKHSRYDLNNVSMAKKDLILILLLHVALQYFSCRPRGTITFATSLVLHIYVRPLQSEQPLDSPLNSPLNSSLNCPLSSEWICASRKF